MFLRLIFIFGSITVGVAAGWGVFVAMNEVFVGWVPLAVSGVTALICFTVLWFLFLRPLAEFLNEKIAVAAQPRRHTLSGVGLDDIPLTAPPKKITPCRICGGPGGPVCSSCAAEMK